MRHEEYMWLEERMRREEKIRLDIERTVHMVAEQQHEKQKEIERAWKLQI